MIYNKKTYYSNDVEVFHEKVFTHSRGIKIYHTSYVK